MRCSVRIVAGSLEDEMSAIIRVIGDNIFRHPIWWYFQRFHMTVDIMKPGSLCRMRKT